jgi:hypothetical protein
VQEAVSHAEQTVAAHDTYQQAHADASRWIEENERALQRCLQSGHEKDETEDNLAVLKVCENTSGILCVLFAVDHSLRFLYLCCNVCGLGVTESPTSRQREVRQSRGGGREVIQGHCDGGSRGCQEGAARRAGALGDF